MFSSAPRNLAYPHDGLSRAMATTCSNYRSDNVSGRGQNAPPSRRTWQRPLPVPAQDRFGRCERRHLGQPCASEWPAFFREKPAFSVGDSQALGPYVGLVDAILGAQVPDGLALSPTHPARHQQDQKLERSLQRHHGPR